MGVWSFEEKSGQGGHALEPTNKSWPHVQKIEDKKMKNVQKRAQNLTGQLSTRSRRATASRGLPWPVD
jgi:hypothetical protein